MRLPRRATAPTKSDTPQLTTKRTHFTLPHNQTVHSQPISQQAPPLALAPQGKTSPSALLKTFSQQTRLARVCPAGQQLQQNQTRPGQSTIRPAPLLLILSTGQTPNHPSAKQRLPLLAPAPQGNSSDKTRLPRPISQPSSALILHLLYLSPPSPRQLFQPISRQMRLVRICPEGHTSTSPNIYSYNSALSPHKKSAHLTNRPTSANRRLPLPRRATYTRRPQKPRLQNRTPTPPPRQNLTLPLYAGAARTRPPLFLVLEKHKKRAAETIPAALRKKTALRPNHPCAKEKNPTGLKENAG